MSLERFPTPSWFVGAGNMVGAMITGWRSAGVDLGNVVAIRPSGVAVAGIGQTVRSLAEAGPSPRLVMLGFKPQMLDAIAPGLAPLMTRETVIVSLLAGTPYAALRTRFPGAGTIVRAMPNLPVAVRRGVTALYTEQAGDADGQLLSTLMTYLGVTVWSPTQAHLASVGAMAGSGPAYVARFIDALAKGAAKRGLDPGMAATLALETVLGTAWLAATDQQPMDDLVRRVASPKGTTLAGLAVLDADLGPLVGRTLDAAIARGEELAAAASANETAAG